jgi:hypothetical protein
MRTLSELMYGVSPQDRNYSVGAKLIITVTEDAIAAYNRQSALYLRTNDESAKLENCRIGLKMATFVSVVEKADPWRDNGMDNPLEVVEGEQLSRNQYSLNIRLKHCITKGQLHAFERHVFRVAKSAMGTHLRLAKTMKCSEVFSIQAIVSTETAARYTA